MASATILIADNHQEFLSARAELLRAKGYLVLEASSLADARRALQELNIDVAVLDLRLQDNDDIDDKSGLDLAREVAPLVPKIILTAYPDYETAVEALKLDRKGWPAALNFVSKTKDVETLIKAIEEALAFRRRSKASVPSALALVIGIDDYRLEIGPLTVCAKDATAIHQVLSPEHYRVRRLLTDHTPDLLPTRNNILAELKNLAASAQPGETVLFYFSGHGVVYKGQSYLMARDTRDSAVNYTAVDVKHVLDELENSQAQAKIIILDACHSGAAIGKAARIMDEKFIEIFFEQAQGVMVLASCKQGERSYEWPEMGQSVFTHYLLEALQGEADFDRKGFVTIQDVIEFVTVPVTNWALERGYSQVPSREGKTIGEIVLNTYR